MSFQKENVCLTCLAPRQTEDPFISVFEKQNSEFTINFLEMLQTLTDIRMHDEFPRSICKECCSILLSSYRFRQTSNDVYKLLCKKLLPIQNGLVDSQPAVPFRSLQINSLQCLQKGKHS